MTASTRVRLIGCFFIILGLKLVILAWAASQTPFLDEWDADAAFLLKPYVEGTFRFWDLFHPHNEHIIFFTRLLTLTLFRASFYWDVVAQMIVNAVIHSAGIVFIAYMLSRTVAVRIRPLCLLLSIAVACVPFGWENILVGFQTQFYLVILLSFASLALLYASPAWSTRWWLGTGLAVASFCSMASGALTLPVVICLYLLQLLRSQRAGAREFFGIAVHIGLTVAMLMAVPSNGGASRAYNISEFVTAAATLLSWPARAPFGLIAYLPTLVLCLSVLKAAPKLADGRWFNVAAFGWVVAQVCAIAIGRANMFFLVSRYFDVLQIGMMVNLASALTLLGLNFKAARFNQLSRAALISWCLFLGVSIGFSTHSLKNQIETKRQASLTQTHNLRGYLDTGDFAYLANKPGDQIPYPSAERLRQWLDDPVIRSFLPPTLAAGVATNGVVEAFKSGLFALRYFVIAFGVLALILSFAIGGSAPEILGKSRE
jgi:hypothetical protein